MKEWPTRVRTGVPPSSVTISGTAREVIRLWITVAPGSLASSRAAISAVSVDGVTIAAALVDEEAAVGVAVEGEADVGALGQHAPSAGRRRFSGSIGLASWFGKVPSSSKYSGTMSTWSPRRSKTAGAVWPAMPLPASTTTFSRRPVTGARASRWAAYAARTSVLADRARRGRAHRGSRRRRRSRISASPVSWPIGRRAGAAHLDAVVLPPGCGWR